MGKTTFGGRAFETDSVAQRGTASPPRTRLRARRSSWVAFGVAASIGFAGARARANGIDPTKISLPKGPGSIEGLASANFSPSLSSGSASYEIPIAVPPASAGFGPKLCLAYDSSGGVSEIGIGWRIGGIPKIRRRTENGLPRFDDTDPFELVGIGIASDLVEVAPGLFRPAVEDGSFVRVERSADGTEWEARTKAGVTLRFGGDGSVEGEGDRVSAYLLREEVDRHGHTIAFAWDAADGHALPTRVVWNAFDDASKNEMRFEYEARSDRHRLFSSGIRETLERRLHAVEVLHGGSLVRRYELGYDEGIHSRLQSVDLVGRDGASRLPESRFDYTDASLVASADQIVTMENAPGQSPKDPDATLADLDGDGLPDLLLGRAGQFRTYLNHDGKRWLAPSDWGGRSPAVSLSSKGVELADLDADGAPDLVVKSGLDSFRYFPRPTGTSFGAPVAITTVPSFSFEDADVRLADMDGDRRADVVVTTDSGIAVGYNLGGTDWTEPSVVGPIDPKAALRFSDGHTSLCDVNGDRVEDVCSLRSGSLTFWLGRGRGVFEPAETASGVPEFDDAAPYELVDVNGDGWTDLVRVGATSIDVAIATAEGGFGSVYTIDGTPKRGAATAVEFADMNASGTTDIVWVDVTGDGTASWRYLELFPNGRAGLLRRIDNGLGKVQTIDYEPAAIQAARARDAGKPWATRMNVAMPVVAEIHVDSSLGDPVLTTEIEYRDGTYDPVERTFAGFGGGMRREIGDAATPTLLTDFTFDAGLVRRELRGMPLSEVTRDEAGSVFSRTTHTYTSRPVAAATNGRAVEYSFESSTRVEHVEGNAAPRTTLTEFEQDDFGDVTEERRWGEVSGDDRSVGKDEAIVARTFANDPDEWLLGQVATEELTDGAGRRVSFTRKYYDGAAFQGLPLGQIARGDVSREEAWTGPDDGAFELVIATRYDADGLPIETRDGMGGGRVFEWASDRTSIASERVKLASPVDLVERATVDGAFGTLLSATDYAGQTTSYEYDAFGRLTKVVKPGDSVAEPTTAYTYDVLAPLSRVVIESRIVSGDSAVERSERLVDGLGRERGTLTRDGDRWILAGVSLFDARGKPRRTLLPRAVDRAAYASPPILDGSSSGRDTFRDALAREIRTRSPAGIETRTEYAPLETRRWDGAQADASSPYEHTPTVERKDGLGRVVANVRTLGGRELAATYAYDARGSLLARLDPEGHAARYDYDGRGRRTAVHDPDLGDARFVYDAAGNVVERTYPDGVTARFTFDLAGRSLTEDHDGDGAPEIEHSWDVAPDGTGNPLYFGKLARTVEPTGSTENTYDARGRVAATAFDIGGSSYVEKSDYDAQDRERIHTYPDGSSIQIRRNARGQIAGYGAAVDIEYGDDGLETARRFNTGVRVESGYDAERRRSELTALAADGSVVEHLQFGYDASGNVTAVTDLRESLGKDRDRTETYRYDNFYRLSAVTGTWGETSYRYSPSGNLVGRTSNVSSLSLGDVAYGTRPHVPSAFDGRPVASDARGRMTNDGTRTYTWNDDDRLVGVSGPNGSVENGFGADGVRRVRVEHRPDGSSTTTRFIDPWVEVRDGKLVRYVVHGGQRIVKLAEDNGALRAAAAPARRGGFSAARAASAPGFGILCSFAFALTVFGLLMHRLRDRASWRRARTLGSVAFAGAAIGAASACGPDGDDGSREPAPPAAAYGSVVKLSEADTLIFTDLVGSVLQETSGTGVPKSEFAAYPFGRTRYDSSDATWKFAGTPRDGAVDLDGMGERFYAPELGVWTSGDPLAMKDPLRFVTADFAAANPYAYARQSPVIAADRDGHFWHVVIGAAVGALFGGGAEAARQYVEYGKIVDAGRVGVAFASGGLHGGIVALNPAAGLASVLGTGAGIEMASGLGQRLLASHGKDAGTVKDAAVDGALGAATAGLAHGAAGLLEKAAPRVLRGLTGVAKMEEPPPATTKVPLAQHR